MPNVTIEWLAGRSLDQKRRVIAAITDALVEHAEARREAVQVTFREMARDDWGRGGLLAVDRSDVPAITGSPGGEGPRGRVAGIGHLLLQTRDLERAEAFYLGFLGFTVKKRETFRDGRPLTVTNEGLGLTDGAAGTPGALEHVAFEATGIRDIAERAAREGVPVLEGPGPGPYALTVYLQDPDGNRVELFSRVEQ